MGFVISQIYPNNHRGIKQVKVLLENEGITLDKNLDYTCCLYDDDYNPVATGSCFGNTLRCFAVSKAHQGEGLLNQVVSHLIQIQFERGNYHLFLYTKCDSAKFFGDLGFYEIARADNRVVFMENRRTGFRDYLKKLEKPVFESKKAAAIVMNANPFTLGHQYLVEKAAEENDIVHLFVVSEDASLVPFAVRKKLVQEGVAHLPNVVVHESGPYIISNATFPSYFLKDEETVMEGHARLDLAVFFQIARELQICRRYVGEEPFSQVTGIYNRIMMEELKKKDIDCIVVPRKEKEGTIISASTVRQYIKNMQWEDLKKIVPDTTWNYFTSAEAQKIIAAIQNSDNVIHY
ncbi:MAG: [citrate (pro-3S)-lyase] ligase [Enterocloster clostridioformis]|nr:[citrate (pro-3S)-lyase] ligase [Enterocloster clostridioformis]